MNLYCVILHQKAANHIERCLGQIHLKLKGAPQFLQSKLFSNFATRNYGSTSHFNISYYKNIDLIEQFSKVLTVLPLSVFWVRPEEIAHGTIVRHLLLSINCPEVESLRESHILLWMIF